MTIHLTSVSIFIDQPVKSDEPLEMIVYSRQLQYDYKMCG